MPANIDRLALWPALAWDLCTRMYVLGLGSFMAGKSSYKSYSGAASPFSFYTLDANVWYLPGLLDPGPHLMNTKGEVILVCGSYSSCALYMSVYCLNVMGISGQSWVLKATIMSYIWGTKGPFVRGFCESDNACLPQCKPWTLNPGRLSL